jgi:iron complex outermembrane recepter protein
MGSRIRPHALGYGVATGMAFWLAAAPLHAQTPPQPKAEVEEEEIVITGSRIKRDEFTSAAPVQVITRERTILEGVTDQAEAIQSTSTAAGSGQINSTFTGFVVDGGPGINTVSLRGLGAQRSLVLLNGRRLPPAGVGGTVGPVDLNILPNSVVNRIEILKDGASSIYGSDAVAGVVNVITRQRLEGGRFGASANNMPGGGDEYQFEGGYGWTWDNASLSIAGEFYSRKELEYGDRSFLACTEDLVTAAAASTMPAPGGYDIAPRPLNAGDRADIIDPRTGRFKCFNHGVSGFIQTFNIFTGALASRTNAAPIAGLTPTAGLAQNNPIPGWRFIPFQERTYDDPRQLGASVVSPADRYSVFIQGDWRPEAFGGAELYTEILANRRESSQDSFRQLFPWVAFDSSVNPFDVNAVGVAATRDVRPILLVPSNGEQEVDVVRALAGLRGDIGSTSWSYDVYASHSASRGDYIGDVIPEDRLVAGTGTFQNGPFTSFATPDGVCPPTAPAGCVPFSGLFTVPGLQRGEFSAAEQAYFFAKDAGNTKFDQTIVEAQFTGNLFELPAGTLAAATGLSFRRDKIDDTPGDFSINRNSWGRITAGRTVGDDSLWEAYAELEVPLLRGVTGFKNLSLNLSGRYSDYDSVGDATTYKVGLNWVLNDWVRVRSTYGTSFRAPALYELFLEDQTSFLSQQSIDPCIRWGDPDAPARPNIQRNCQAAGITDPLFPGGSTSALITTGGGLGRLEPEDSESLSVGLVLTPPDWGLNIAVDYFDIEVNNQVTSLAAAVVGACYSFEPFPTPGFCDLFTRGADLGIETIDASYRNVPSQRTSGIDLTIAYEKDFTFGALSIDSQITYTEDDETELFPGRSFLPNGTIGEPEWVGSVQTRFERGDWTFAWTLNYTGKGDQLGYENEDGIVLPLAGLTVLSENNTRVEEFVTNDLSVRYLADKWQAVFAVTNVLNERPPLVGLGDDAGSVLRIGNVPLSSQYFSGLLGRSFFINVEYEF